MFHRLGYAAVRYRWLIIAIWALALMASAPVAPRIASVLQPGGFTSPDLQSQRALDLLQRNLRYRFTSVDIIFTSNRLSVDNPRFPREANAAVAELAGWKEVYQILPFTQSPQQISRDRHAAYTIVFLNSDLDSAPNLLAELRHRLQPQPDLRTQVGGSPVFYQDIQTVSERDLRRAELIAFPFAILALLLVFRSVVAAALPAVVGGCSVAVALALIFALGHVTPLSIFILNITTLLGLGLGVDYSLFIVSRFREELPRHERVADAVATAIATAGRAVFFSGVTVSIGLAGLILFQFNMLRSVGVGGVLVVVLSILAALTLLPAVLSVLGPRINAFPVRLRWRWGRVSSEKTRFKPQRTGRPMPELQRSHEENAGSFGLFSSPAVAPRAIHAADDNRDSGLEGTGHGFWHNLAALVMRYPVQVFVPVLAVLILLGSPFLRVRLGAPDASILPTSVPSRQTYDLLETRFNIEDTTPIIIAVQANGSIFAPQNVRALYAYTQQLASDPRVAHVEDIVSLDPRITLPMYELLYKDPARIADPFVRQSVDALAAGNTTMVQVISRYPMLDARSEALVAAIRNTLPPGGMHILVDGGTAGAIDYVNTLYTDFPRAALIIMVVTYIILFLSFRSVVLPLKAIAMNILSILASYGALVYIFQEGHFHRLLNFTPLGYVEASIPILMFCALFGLSMDYEVFLLSRVKEAYDQSHDNTAGVAMGLERSGRIVTSAALIVVVVSSSFIAADMILVKAIGLGMALAVFLDATLVRGLLVPATMRLLGSVNWWLPRPLARILPGRPRLAPAPGVDLRDPQANALADSGSWPCG
jgi:RND superfamily putative drug exporter